MFISLYYTTKALLIGFFRAFLLLLYGAKVKIVSNIHKIHELGTLTYEIKKNREWVYEFLEKKSVYLSDLVIALSNLNEEGISNKGTLLSQVKKYFCIHQDSERIRVFFIAYVEMHISPQKLGLLNEQIHIWRTTRAISMTFILSAFVLVMLNDWSNLIAWQVAIGVLVIATIVESAAYKRMLITLFAFTREIEHIEIKEETI